MTEYTLPYTVIHSVKGPVKGQRVQKLIPAGTPLPEDFEFTDKGKKARKAVKSSKPAEAKPQLTRGPAPKAAEGGAGNGDGGSSDDGAKGAKSASGGTTAASGAKK